MEKKDVWTISSLLNWTVNYFKSKNIQSARLDAEVLLSHVLRQERIYLYVHFDEPMEQNELSKFREYVKKRAQHVPIAYIIGEREFMGLPFKVTKDTLIPRPDTEILVENVLNNVDKDKEIEIVDIGTGSGAIILSLLVNLPKAQGKTVDISSKAIEVAKENAVNLQVNDRCEFFVGDLFAPLNDNKFDVIVSNPPYIPQKDIATLEDDVKEYEPVSALTDGGDGLSYYRRLLSEGKAYIKENGFIALEIGIYQSNDVKQIAMDNGWKNIKIIKDYAGIDRVVLAWNVN
ncbi:peptide chain release factor N(5)-glutamine methyltransferase [Megamonas hypermegale]|jgi:release factor glutamine methyltransferase|uniref:peptide chain release factor N(5)-glutamine methyltransferase n=1 Tax=Megamonas hypermegale TaxID=158847 RepID=UPI00195E14C5|nr:peptide chain release factor N(5)-glutamine methyltransferase [Megamonas hypermegale]MBM6834259.1 peptide chain release factor N(5)-glutamine methyltransferase [Megamonas hypermegale]